MKKSAYFAWVGAALFSGAVMAQQGFYVGASAGQSNTRFASGDYALESSLLSGSQENNDLAWKSYIGYEILKYVAIEGGYADFGKPKYKHSGFGALAGTSAQVLAKESAWFVALKGTAPVSEQLNLIGKLGVTWNRLDAAGSSNNSAVNAAFGMPWKQVATKTDALIGLGVEYVFSKHLVARAEYEDFGAFENQNPTRRTKVQMWSAGIGYRF